MSRPVVPTGSARLGDAPWWPGDAPPTARREGLLTRRVNQDLVVYDCETHRATSLDRTAREVWSWCDGATPVAEMVRRAQAGRSASSDESEAVVRVTLARLAEAGLLTDRLPEADAGAEGGGAYDRRRCLFGLAALPVVASVLVPRAVDAQSLSAGMPCSSSSQCSTGCCNSASNRCTGGGPSCL